MNKIYLLPAAFLFTFLLPLSLFAQSPPAYAIENVTIHQSDGSVIESGAIIWRDGVIEAVGSNSDIPFDAYSVIDGGDSLHVYPGFIDGLGTWGSPNLPENPRQTEDPGNPPYDRAGIQPERSASEYLDASGDTITSVMKAGFAAANLGLKGYMLPGRPDLFFLNGEETPDNLFRESTGYQFAFEGAPGGWTSRAYPATTMGVMAQFRQLMYNAEALQEHIQYFADANGSIQPPKRNEVIESLFPVLNGDAKLFANIDTPENFERLMILNDEFGLNITIVSGKSMFYKSSELKEMNIPVLASIELPEKPKWMKDDDDDEEEDDEEEPDEPESEEEEHYRERQAEAYRSTAENIRTLLDEGIQVGFASAGLKADKLLESLRTLKEEGDLSDDEILQILTINTTEILNIDEILGDLKPGKNASFAVFNSPFLEEKSAVKMIISNGEIHEF